MQRKEKSAGLIIVSLIFTILIEGGVGYLLYLKWLADGPSFMMARDYSAVVLTSIATILLILEIMFIVTTASDRKYINFLNDDNTRMFDANKDLIAENKKLEENAKRLAKEIYSVRRKAEETEETEETEDVETSVDMSDTENEAETESTENTVETNREALDPNVIEKDLAKIRLKLHEIDAMKKYPSVVLEIKLKDMTADQYYDNMKNIFRRKAVWTSPAEDTLLLFFINDKQKNIMDFVWNHIVYQKEVKIYNVYNLSPEETAEELIEELAL